MTFAEKRSEETQVYEGTLHGWCPPDSRVYSETQAERARERLLPLFSTSLRVGAARGGCAWIRVQGARESS